MSIATRDGDEEIGDEELAATVTASQLTGGLGARLRAWLRNWLGLDEAIINVILGQQQLIEGMRRDFDHLGEVLGLRDKLDDDRNKSHTETANQLVRATRELRNLADLLYSVQDRLNWHEVRNPQLHKSKKAYDAAIAQERRRREQLVTEHPELSEEGRAIVIRTGKLPEPAAAAAPRELADVGRIHDVSGDAALPPDVVRRLELIRSQTGRTPSPSEREAAAEAAAADAAAHQPPDPM